MSHSSVKILYHILPFLTIRLPYAYVKIVQQCVAMLYHMWYHIREVKKPQGKEVWLEMSDVLKLLELRQGDKSNEQYANEMGLRGTTLWRYKKGQSEINTATRKKLMEYYAARQDAEMVGALLVYKTGSQLSSSQLAEIGRYYLQSIKPVGKPSPLMLASAA